MPVVDDPIRVGPFSGRGPSCSGPDLRVFIVGDRLVVDHEWFRAELGPMFDPPRKRADVTCTATIQLDAGPGRRVVLDDATHTQTRQISPRSELRSTATVEFGGGTAPFDTTVRTAATPVSDDVVLPQSFPAPLTGACGRATLKLTSQMVFQTQDATQPSGVRWTESRLGARTVPC
ncbi:hypothetical protein GCM10010124_06000 [Pilimelia terevasa]|uniref:Uncharacterized protein n=1 Tax=Pilimelia terevasa TaxID=53372 RepID=A0A8J3FEM2_9ACTN|nr:hypothetical protein [Pilimelia terevasa]GGK16175.1 hypothetical protein GCM10010124_06000 [Pilimelia terevasa]